MSVIDLAIIDKEEKSDDFIHTDNTTTSSMLGIAHGKLLINDIPGGFTQKLLSKLP